MQVIRALMRCLPSAAWMPPKPITKLLKTYKKLPDTKEILTELDSLQEKKNTLMKEYSESKTNMDDLFVIRKNFEQYMGKEMER